MTGDIKYKDWSLGFHIEHAHQPIAVQIELTYQCPLHCTHCYSECYNAPEYSKDELSTPQLKKIIDKLYHAGCLWLCYTGGDPLIRPDFIECYEYANRRGFIITIFTSLAALTDDTLARLIKRPPFLIETTLNAATKDTYEKISQVEGSFDRVLTNIRRILDAKLPLKIKTLLTKSNIHEREQLGKLIESFGVEFRPSTEIYAGLNGDTTPCLYRLSIYELVRKEGVDEGLCKNSPSQTGRFFRCAIGNWQWRIDPYGRLNICICVREPSYDLLNGDMMEGVRLLSGYTKARSFSKDSECRDCKIRHLCQWCPGKAGLEVGDEEMPIPYYCQLAKRRAFRKDHEDLIHTRSL